MFHFQHHEIKRKKFYGYVLLYSRPDTALKTVRNWNTVGYITNNGIMLQTKVDGVSSALLHKQPRSSVLGQLNK